MILQFKGEDMNEKEIIFTDTDALSECDLEALNNTPVEESDVNEISKNDEM